MASSNEKTVVKDLINSIWLQDITRSGGKKIDLQPIIYLLSYPVKPTILSQDNIQLTEEEIDEKMRVEDNQDIDEYNEAQHSLQS